ncbi:uncharacterized protein LOC141903255 [Tubulanus polymorphus]|uniref:uncharacterized protein LOC141903255 n=1 Tax=Tubulanus polymorphus TaxID=672921 RepID=UPI003DA58B18
MAEKNTRESSDDMTNDSDGEEIDDIWRQRMETTDWCDCQCCEIMETPEENACCNEKGPILARIEKYNDEYDSSIKCITCHPGFRSNCLDIWVLETAYYQYRQQYRAQVDGEINEKYRYVAYRQLVRWCWGFLGEKNRVPLPACALEVICQTFPAIGDNVGFKYLDLDQIT